MHSISIWHFVVAFFLVTLISFINKPLEQQIMDMMMTDQPIINTELNERQGPFKSIARMYSAIYVLGAVWSGYRLKASLKGQGFLTILTVFGLALFCYLLSLLQTAGLKDFIGATFPVFASLEARYLSAYVYTLVYFATTILFAWAANKLWQEECPAGSIVSAALCIQFTHFFLLYFLA